MDLSVVVPLYNEEECVAPLYGALRNTLDQSSLEYELLFVDDGSNDKTFQNSTNLAATDKQLRVIQFRRNYGQTPAMAAGIDLARGDIIVTMDGDLQNDPADIPLLVKKINEGYDIVVGWRFDRQDKLLSRKIPARSANWLIGKVTGVPIKDNGCSLKAFRSEVIKHVPLYSDMHRFIPAMASIAGPRIAEIKVRHHARRFGKSKYGLSRVYKVLLDLFMIKVISSFSERPLLWFAMLALPVFAISVLMTLWTVYNFVVLGTLSLSIASSALILMSLCFFLLVAGTLGEIVYRTAHATATPYALLTATELTPADVRVSD